MIDKNSIPQYDKLIEPVVLALKNLGGSGTNQEITEKVIELADIPEEVAKIPHNNKDGRTELEYRIAWAKTYLKRAGYINNPQRGVWELNDGVNTSDISASRIVDFVRNQAFEMTENLKTSNITSIEAAQAFENFVIKTLQEYFHSENITYTFDNSPVKADLYIPSGVADIEKRVYIKILYGNYQTNMEGIIDFCDYRSAFINKKDDHILFIVNKITLNDFDQLPGYIKSEFGINITIWDIYDLTEAIPTFASRLDYLSKPRAAIVEDIKENKNDTTNNENQKKINVLREAYANENLVLFIGAGISMDAGIPLWNELVNKLLLKMLNVKFNDDTENDDEDKYSGLTTFSQSDIDEITTIAMENKEDTPLMQMRYIKAALNEDEYYKIVHDELYADTINVNTDMLNAISHISKPRRRHKGLESIVTYNFDNLLEQNLEEAGIEYKVICNDRAVPETDKLNIYHVHGYLPQNESKDTRSELIFSEEDYHKVYGDAYCWSNMAQVKAFQDNVCLLIGSSLTDPNIRRLLDSAMHYHEKARHFVILKRKHLNTSDTNTHNAVKWYQNLDDKIRSQIFNSFGLNVIWVNEYSEIPGILRSLQKKK